MLNRIVLQQGVSLKRFFALFLFSSLFLLPSLGIAQGAHRINQVIAKGNGIGANVGPGSKILVCVLNTGCATAANIYLDAALTTPAPNPVTADGAGNYDYYVAGGCVDEQISSPGQSHIFLSHVCPFNGQSGGGGGLNPGVQNQVVFYPTSGTTGGPTNVQVDNATGNFLTAPNTNGYFNTDRYLSGGGNNGFANLLATTCVSGGCLGTYPANSTSTENAYSIFSTVANTQVADYRKGSQGGYYYDPIANGAGGFNPTGQPFSGAQQMFGTWDKLTQAPDFSQKQAAQSLYLTFNGPGFDLGSPFPGWSGPAWSLQSGISMTMNDSTPGIGQMFGGQFSKFSIGDSQNFYFYNHCDGGAIASADEGCTGGGIQRLQNATWLHATAASGSTTGTQLLKTNFVSGRTQPAIGGVMLDISRLVGVGTVTGVATQVPTLAAWSTPVTGVTFTESTAWAQANSAIPAPPNPASLTPQSDTVNFTVLGGTNAGGFTTGPACLDGEELYESVQITAVGAISGGVQSVTFNHFFPNGQVGTSLWQGAPCGTYYIPQKDYLNGWNAPYVVFGATDTGHLVGRFFAVSKTGNPTNNTLPIPSYYTAVTANVPLSALSVSGTTVTATYGANNNLQYNGLSGAVVSGCVNSSYNGTTGAISAVNQNQLQWTQTGPSGTSTSCLLSFPSSTFNFYLIPGAELKGPCTTAGCTLEPNTVAWTYGDTVENPPNPAFRGYTLTMNDQINTQNPLVGTGGISISTEGDGASGNYTIFGWSNNVPMNHYIGDGGKLAPPKFVNIAGPTGNILVDQFAPIDGSYVFNVGCAISAQGGCSSSNNINLWEVNNTGTMSYTPLTQTFNFNNVYGSNTVSSPILSTGTVAHGGTPVALSSANSQLNNIPLGDYGVFGNGTTMDNSATISAKEFDSGLIYGGTKPPSTNGVLVEGTGGSSTWSYVAKSVTQAGESLQSNTATTNLGNATLSSSNFNALNVTPGLGAQMTNVYRIAAPAGYTLGLICQNVTNALINFGGCTDKGQSTLGPVTSNVDASGSVQSPSGVFATSLTIAGQNVCQANGTNCPAAAPAAAGSLTGTTLNSTVANSSLISVGTLGSLNVTGAISAGSVSAGNGFTGTKTAGTCVFTIVNGIITNVGGC